MKRLVTLCLALAVSAPLLGAKPPVMRHEFLSDVYTIDKKYKSMEGPGSIVSLVLGDKNAPPELLWITGVKTEMVGEDGYTPQLPEFMCHVNVDLDVDRHATLFSIRRPVAQRLITLSQGITDTKVPDGFGFPIASNEPLSVFTQVLNHNIENPGNLKVRHRVTFTYVRDSDLTEPMKPLMNVGASGMVILANNPLAINPDMAAASTGSGTGGSGHGESCLMAARAPNAAGMSSDYVDPKGRKMTGHWVVPPGRQVNHSDITWFMALPFDLKLHYAAVHLHPFAEALEVRDVTANKTMFIARARSPEGKVGLDHVDTFLSTEGLQFYKDHKYDLISTYNNPTKETHDSMASVFLGFADPKFRKPTTDDLIAATIAADDKSNSDTARLDTTFGSIPVKLLRDVAPKTSRQFTRLLRTGLLTGAKVTHIEQDGDALIVKFSAPMTKERRRVITRLPREAEYTVHEGGTLSICTDEGEPEAAFEVVLGRAAGRDRRCTVFATIGIGSPAVRHLTSIPRDEKGNPLEIVEITGGEVTEAPPPPVQQQAAQTKM